MKHYQIPNTQVVRLSSGEVMQIVFQISGAPTTQENAMAPRRIYGK